MAPVRTRKAAKRPRTTAPTARGPRARHTAWSRYPLRAAFVVAGTVGLVALAISLFGPRRFRDEIVGPIGAATYVPIAAKVAPQADRVWEETRAWRDRVGRILESVNTEEVRELVAARMSKWLDRFR